MTTAEAAESGTVEDTTAAAQAAVSSQDDDKDYEAEAREMGWVPEEEFKGDRPPKVFKSARQFLEDIPPYVKKLLERQEAKFSDRVAKLEKVNDRTVAKITAIHNQEIADLKAAKTAAVKEGDVGEVERLDAEIDKRKNDAPLTDDPKAVKAAAEKAFGDANPWYGSNRKMTAFARGLSNDLSVENPNLTYEDNIAAVLKAVREEFPEYYDKKTTANGHAAVDGGSENPGGSNKSSPLAKLSAEERAKAKDDMKKFPKVYPDEAAWLKAYNS